MASDLDILEFLPADDSLAFLPAEDDEELLAQLDEPVEKEEEDDEKDDDFDEMLGDVVNNPILFPVDMGRLERAYHNFDDTLGQIIDYDPDQELSLSRPSSSEVDDILSRNPAMSAVGRGDEYVTISDLLGGQLSPNYSNVGGYEYEAPETVCLVDVFAEAPDWSGAWATLQELGDYPLDCCQADEDGVTPLQWASEYLKDPQTLGMMTPERFEQVKDEYAAIKNIFAYAQDHSQGRVWKDGSQGIASRKELAEWKRTCNEFEVRMANRAKGRFVLLG